MLHIPEKAPPTNEIDKVSPLLDHLLLDFKLYTVNSQLIKLWLASRAELVSYNTVL